MSKKIVKISKVELAKSIHLDYRAIYQYNGSIDFDSYVKNFIKPSSVYAQIVLKNIKSLSSEVLKVLTNHYLGGTAIVVQNTKGQEVKFKCPYPMQRYLYSFIDYKKAETPKSLALRPIAGTGKTFFEILLTAKGNYIPNELWKEIDVYNQERIQKCKAYNQFDFTIAENWYKELMNVCAHININVYSPNAKTFYEHLAEIKFLKAIEDQRLPKDKEPLTEEQIRYLKKYAPMYGVDIPLGAFRFAYRKTKHGYTQEPEIVHRASASEINRVYYDARNQNNLPKYVRDQYTVKEYENMKDLVESFERLKYLQDLNDDMFLAPGYKRCPICQEIYNELDGCEDHILPLQELNLSNIFDGEPTGYTDIEVEVEYLRENQDELGL